MSNYCAIDFGTSNSAIGLYINGKAELVHLEGKSSTIPSAIFYDEDSGEVIFGKKAMDSYISGKNGRLLRALKSVLGSSLINETTKIGNKKVEFSTIIETFIRYLKEETEKQYNIKLDKVLVGRPIHFVDHRPEKDNLAQESLKQAAINAGFKQVEFQYEPIGAAFKFENSLKEDKTVMIIDIGGGTSDISILKLSPKNSNKKNRSKDCLASSGIHIGGTDFDSKLSLKNIMPLLGYGLPLQKNGLHIPNNIYTTLATWHKIPITYSVDYNRKVNKLESSLKELNHFHRLQTVLKEGLGFSLAIKTEEAKISLSNKNKANVKLDSIEKDLQAIITSEGLEKSLNKSIKDIIETANLCIEKAKLTIEDIDSIFLTGGSSQMSIIKHKIEEAFPNISVNNSDALSSVALGLVIDARNRFE